MPRSMAKIQKKKKFRDFLGGPVVKTSPSNAGGVGSIPGQGAKIPHASWPNNQNIKQKHYCNKFNKDFKKWSTLKKKKSLRKYLEAQREMPYSDRGVEETWVRT